MSPRTIVLLAQLVCVTALASEKKAHDLSSSRDLIKGAENKETFDYQMGNTDTQPDLLGEKLPPTMRRDRLIEALLNGVSVNHPADLRVGAKAHPKERDVSIVWVHEDEGWNGKPARLWIGLLKGNADRKVQSEQWLSKPIRAMQLYQHEVPFRFDFAAYDLGKLGRAFGLRTNINSCGAGGSICWQTDLSLFTVVGGALARVFEGEVGYFGNYAGDWNEDGTRDHSVVEQEATVHVLKRAGKGIPDLEIRLRGEKLKRQRFVWTETETAPGHYATEDPAIMDTLPDL
jgi:hypothetical protein